LTPEVRKELDDLLTIAQNWVNQDVRTADCDGKDGFLVDDFIEFLSLQVMPYARRLRECDYITTDELAAFIFTLRRKADDFRKRLKIPDDD
jgi:hypothetical protein